MKLLPIVKSSWNKGKTKKDFPQMSNSGVKIGNVPFNKGKILSEDHKKKLSLAQTERMKDFNLRKRISKTMKGIKRMGRPKVPAHLQKTDGVFRKEAKIRDNYTCQDCGLYEPEIMEVDHIKPKYKYPELRNELANLVTLCPNCHKRKTVRNKENNSWYKRSKIKTQKYE